MSKKVMIYCAGREAQKFYYKAYRLGIDVECFIDKNKTGYLFDKKIYRLDEALLQKNYFVVVACGENLYFEIKQILQDAGKIEFRDFCYHKLINDSGQIKKICLLNMNCYMIPIGEYLSSSRSFKEEYCIYPIEPIYCRKKGEISELLLEHVDLYIHQIISSGNPFDYQSSDEFCLKKLKKDCVKITLPNFYPNGAKVLFPYLTKEFHTGCFYEDEWIEAALENGCTTSEEILRFIENMEIPSDSFEKLENWFEWLEYRDKRYDVKVASYIRDNCQRIKLFNDMGHPTSSLTIYICEQLAGILGIDDISLNDKLSEIGYEHFIWTPIANAYGMKFEQNRVRANCPGTVLCEEDKEVDPLEFINEYIFCRKNGISI
jgi:hypothetical protein